MAKKIAVLVSGGGTNLQALIDAQGSVLNSGRITLVVANNANAYALERAKKAGIDTAVVLKKECGSQEAFETRLMEVLDESGIDIIILAGFMTILTERFTGHYPKRILNVHPSLIPAFCGEGFYGLRVHEEALKYGVKVTGATVHFVNAPPGARAGRLPCVPACSRMTAPTGPPVSPASRQVTAPTKCPS